MLILVSLILVSLALAQECEVGMTKVEGGYEYTCIQEDDGFLFWLASGCVSPVDDSVQPADSKFQNNYYAYECKLFDDGSVGLEIVGCVNDGAVVAEGEKVTIDEYVWMCTKKEHYLELEPTGCVVDGGEIPIGETFDLAGFWYTCSGPDPLVRKIEGCVSPSDGARLNNGEVYFKNGFAVSCNCNEKSCTHSVTACEGHENGVSVVKNVGQEWMEGTAPFLYKLKCSTCSQGTTVVRTIPQCSDGDFVLKPGCYASGPSGPVGCGINEEQTLQMISGTDEELTGQGFTAC
jgi:hypothetical protein